MILAASETAADGTKALGIEATGRFAILPDFFADDIVIDAADPQFDEEATPRLLASLGAVEIEKVED